MRSVKACFNPTLFKKNLTRFWPIWGLYLVVWLFSFPFALLMGDYNTERFVAREVLDAVGEIGMVTALIFAVLAAMALWSYLFNSRSACLMHQLPVRREGLFLTNYLSGLTFFVLPNAAVFVLTLLAEVAVGEVNVPNLLIWLVGVTLIDVFFFSFATFCAMFTGHILALPVFYAILNGLIWAMAMLINLVLDNFLFGYTGMGIWEEIIIILTPVWLLGNVGAYMAGDGSQTYHFEGMPAIVLYAVTGLILAGVTLIAYRRRHMEKAGDVVTVRWVQPIFRYGVAFCSALALGLLLSEMFGSVLPDNTLWSLFPFMIICGIVGYFAASMLLEKSFRVLNKWKGCAVFLAVLAVLTCALEYDLTGYSRWVPEKGNVESVSISMETSRPYDNHYFYVEAEEPQTIQAAIEAHQAIVDQGRSKNLTTDWVMTEEGYQVQTLSRSGMTISYTLKNGRVVTRDFEAQIMVAASDLKDPASAASKLNALINMPEVVKKIYNLSDLKVDKINSICVDTVTMMNEYGMNMQEVEINREAYEKVIAAIQRDLEEGNYRRYLMDDEARKTNCMANEILINLEYAIIYDEDPEITGSITREYMHYYSDQIRVTLQATAKHTLAALDEAGVLKTQLILVTQAQQDALSDKWGYTDPLQIDIKDYAWAVIGPEPEQIPEDEPTLEDQLAGNI